MEQLELHFAVYLIDPRFRKYQIDAEEVIEGQRYLKKFVGNEHWTYFHEKYMTYVKGEEIFSK